MDLDTRSAPASSNSPSNGAPAGSERKHAASGSSYAAQAASLVPRDGAPVQMRAAGIAALQMKTPQQEATELEARDGGHSLARHGPDVTDDALKKRLDTGVAPDGAFCCAPGLSTRFVSYEEYLKTRTDAAAAMDLALVQTKATLKGAIDGYDTERVRVQKLPSSPDKPAEIAKVTAKRDELEAAAAKIVVPSTTTAPVKVGRMNLGTPGAELLQTLKNYEVVKAHGRDVGEGFAGADEKPVADPTVGSTKTGKGYKTITKAPNMKKTRTTYAIGAVKKLSDVGAAAGWKAVQHFPCDETEGIS